MVRRFLVENPGFYECVTTDWSKYAVAPDCTTAHIKLYLVLLVFFGSIALWMYQERWGSNSGS